jgi:hypothetical protein
LIALSLELAEEPSHGRFTTGALATEAVECISTVEDVREERALDQGEVIFAEIVFNVSVLAFTLALEVRLWLEIEPAGLVVHQ